MNDKKPSAANQAEERFAGLYLLNLMLEERRHFDVLLPGDDKYLEPLFEALLQKEWVEIKEQKEYAPTVKGEQALSHFLLRYTDFLRHFDVFCAVDLLNGKFAFEKYFEFEEEESWKNYLSQPHWDDLRLAVARYKKLDPLELVFMSFLNEGRLSKCRAKSGWQFDLVLGSFWKEAHAICDSALKVEELGYEEGGEFISGEKVLLDVMESGATLNQALFEAEAQQEKERAARDPMAQAEDYEVFENYAKDPDYVNPCWKS